MQMGMENLYPAVTECFAIILLGYVFLIKSIMVFPFCSMFELVIILC